MNVREITVNKECFLNQENIIKSKEYLKVAISILAKDNENTKGFLHFCLAADTDQQCYEDFEMGLIRNRNNTVEYISKIKIYDTYEDVKNDNIKPTILKKLKTEIKDFLLNNAELYIVVVFGKDNETLALAYVYNYHSGYYAHEVAIVENNNIEVNYL